MRLAAILLCLVLVFTCLPTALAVAEPSVQAPAALLVETSTGAIVYSRQADEHRPVASIVKTMMILLALEAVDSGEASIEDPVSISQIAASMGGSQALLDAGETQPLGALLMSVIVASANDSAVALGEYLFGSVEGAVERMNARAAELGMNNTHYVNVTGLPAENQYTTARDVAVVSMEILKHPKYFEYSGIWMVDFVHNTGRVTGLTNTNRLIRFYQGADGVKTGSTAEAKYCVSATAERDGLRFLAVILGSPSGSQRFADAETLLDYGFQNYRLENLLSKEQIVAENIPVEKGREPAVSLVSREEVTVLVPKTGPSGYGVRLDIPETLSAPLRKEEEAGEAAILFNGESVRVVPLFPAEDVDSTRIADQFDLILSLWPALRPA